MSFKKIKKYLKSNDSNLSMVLGLIVIIIVGFFIINNFNGSKTGEIIPSIGTEREVELGLNQKYTVQKGDDLWKIAEKNLSSGYDWKKIADINNIKAPYTIETGQELIIPKSEAITTLPKPTLKPTSFPITEKETIEKPISSETYVVVKGDNLWNIAVRSYGDGYKWVDIAKANNLKNPDIIHSGNVFVIPR